MGAPTGNQTLIGVRVAPIARATNAPLPYDGGLMGNNKTMVIAGLAAVAILSVLAYANAGLPFEPCIWPKCGG